MSELRLKRCDVKMLMNETFHSKSKLNLGKERTHAVTYLSKSARSIFNFMLCALPNRISQSALINFNIQIFTSKSPACMLKPQDAA